MRGDGYRNWGDTRPSRYYNSIFEAQSFVCGHFQVQLQRMTKIVLLRHGESVWNKENRFTGWTDVDLSEKGLAEAHEAGRLLRDGGFVFDIAYTSVLARALRTCWIVVDELNALWIPMEKSWRLNERHYGALQGLNKAETAAKHGDEQGKIWRRSFDIAPPPPGPAGPRRRRRHRPAAAAGHVAPRVARQRRPLQARRNADHRVAQGHDRPLPPLLDRK